jgi:tetratricopeptide (TPR) repeat protein
VLAVIAALDLRAGAVGGYGVAAVAVVVALGPPEAMPLLGARIWAFALGLFAVCVEWNGRVWGIPVYVVLGFVFLLAAVCINMLMMWRATAAAEAGDWDRMLRWARRFDTWAGDPAFVHVARSEAWREQGRLDDSMSEALAVRASDHVADGRAFAGLLEGLVFLERGDAPAALKALDEFLATMPGSMTGTVGRGRARMLAGDTEGAAADARRALELSRADETPCMPGQVALASALLVGALDALGRRGEAELVRSGVNLEALPAASLSRAAAVSLIGRSARQAVAVS